MIAGIGDAGVLIGLQVGNPLVGGEFMGRAVIDGVHGLDLSLGIRAVNSYIQRRTNTPYRRIPRFSFLAVLVTSIIKGSDSFCKMKAENNCENFSYPGWFPLEYRTYRRLVHSIRAEKVSPLCPLF